MSSEPMTAWVVVLAEPNEDDELVELLEVDASRIPDGRDYRSEHDWFMDNHWDNNAEECFWDKKDRPEPGEYLIKFYISGGWTHSSNGSDYDEEIFIESITPVDLGGINKINFLDKAHSCFREPPSGDPITDTPAGCYGTSAKEIRELLDNFNDADDLHIDGMSLGGFSTKQNQEIWEEINTVADADGGEGDPKMTMTQGEKMVWAATFVDGVRAMMQNTCGIVEGDVAIRHACATVDYLRRRTGPSMLNDEENQMLRAMLGDDVQEECVITYTHDERR